MTGTLAPSVTATAQRCVEVLAEVEQVIVGKHEAVSQVLLGILASGHLLIEDLPGLGKTLLARTFAATLGLQFTRVGVHQPAARRRDQPHAAEDAGRPP
jgi:MoxR-like ATPase